MKENSPYIWLQKTLRYKYTRRSFPDFWGSVATLLLFPVPVKCARQQLSRELVRRKLATSHSWSLDCNSDIKLTLLYLFTLHHSTTHMCQSLNQPWHAAPQSIRISSMTFEFEIKGHTLPHPLPLHPVNTSTGPAHVPKHTQTRALSKGAAQT